MKFKLKIQGFTLLEILIALAVFAILATLTSTTLYNALNTKKRVGEQAKQLNELQLAFTLIERDLLQVVNRKVRGDDMRLVPSFMGELNYLEFTRGGVINPNAIEKRSSLKRVALLCKDNKLLRRTWQSLDSTKKNLYADQVLLQNLINCQFAYMNRSSQILNKWQADALQQNQRPEPIPKACQLNLTSANWGKVSLLFIIPAALYGEK